MGWLGDHVAMAEGPCSPLPFVRQNVQEPEQSAWERNPRLPVLLLGMCRHLEQGRSPEKEKTEEKISKHLLNICVGTGVVLVPSFLDFTEY